MKTSTKTYAHGPTVREELCTLSTEVPPFVRTAVEKERVAQNRPSKSNTLRIILQDWARKSGHLEGAAK